MEYGDSVILTAKTNDVINKSLFPGWQPDSFISDWGQDIWHLWRFKLLICL